MDVWPRLGDSSPSTLVPAGSKRTHLQGFEEAAVAFLTSSWPGPSPGTKWFTGARLDSRLQGQEGRSGRVEGSLLHLWSPVGLRAHSALPATPLTPSANRTG